MANDVIQNSRKKGPEFRTEFGNLNYKYLTFQFSINFQFTGPILGPALQKMAQAVDDENTQKRLERILNIWAERNLFDAKQIVEYRKSLCMHFIFFLQLHFST